VELLGVAIDKSRIEAAGAGGLLCENCSFRQNGAPNVLVVNHAEADVTLVGGDITNGAEWPVGGPSADHYHAWQKLGRLRVYGTTVEATLGQAGFRFDTTSTLGPHVLADVRARAQTANTAAPTPGPRPAGCSGGLVWERFCPSDPAMGSEPPFSTTVGAPLDLRSGAFASSWWAETPPPRRWWWPAA
jgi:hypothetical protein